MEICPSAEELTSTVPSHLNVVANLVSGPYADSVTYLDTQFRLLRADLVESWREAIELYNQCEAERDKRKRVIEIYENVSFNKC